MRREHDFIFPPPRGARGRGTARSVVEGACGSSACSNGQKKHHRPRPSHRPNARLPPRCAGRDKRAEALREPIDAVGAICRRHRLRSGILPTTLPRLTFSR